MRDIRRLAKPTERGAGLQYLVALAATGAAVGLRALIDPWLGDALPLVTLFGAVAVAVWFGGYRPAILSVLLGWVACNYLFVEPRGTFTFGDVASGVGLIAFLVSSAIIIGFGEVLRVGRRRAHEQQELLRVTLASIGDAVVTTDAAGRVTSLNPVAAELTGWSQEEAAGRPLPTGFNIVNEQTRDPVENPVQLVLQRGQVVGLANHTVLISRDGTERAVDDSAAPIRDDDGRLIGVVLVFRDVTDKREMERRVHQSERELTDFFEQAAIGIHWVGPDGRILRANRAELAMLGYPAEEYVGRHVAEFHTDQALIGDMLRRLSTGETIVDQETQLRCRDGSSRIVLVSADARREGASLAYSRWFVRDVTAQRLAEAASRELAAIVESSDDAIVAKGLDGRVRSWNRGAQRVFGYTAEEMIGQPITILIPGDYVAEEEAILTPIRRGERVAPYETVRRHKDGRLLPISLTVSPIVDGEGRVVGASKIARDISARKRAEEALRRWEHIFQHAGWPVAVETAAGDVLRTVNRAYAAMHGYAIGELVGRPLLDVLAPESRGELPAHIQAAHERGDYVYESVHVRKDGSAFPCLTHVTVFKDHSGCVEYRAATLQDLTAVKAAEQELRGADRRKDEFLATLAHELRNPLAPIRNAVEVLKGKGELDPHVAWGRDVIDRQVRTMARLLDDLLDVSRISRNRLDLRRQRVTLAAVIDSAVETSRPLIDAAEHELVISLPSTPVHLDADPVRLAQVFSNLLNNAAKFSHRGGHIEIVAELNDGHVRVSVNDRGRGIGEEVMPHLFELFAQDPLDRDQSGVGIGLALARGLVELHGGRIEARSEGPGRGAELIVELPLASAAPPVDSAREPSVQPRGGAPARHRVLVVDDHRDSADSMAMMLGIMGHEVRVAYDGAEGTATAGAWLPDVVLLDIGMPKLDGHDVCRFIRAQPWGSRMRIIAMTGWGQREDRRRTEEAGFDDHLVKPVEPAELEKLLVSGE